MLTIVCKAVLFSSTLLFYLINILYFIIYDQISKVAIEKCDDYSNCRDCLQARNPYCGWCSLEKRYHIFTPIFIFLLFQSVLSYFLQKLRCTAKSACYNSTGLNAFDKTSSNSLWLSLDAQQCIDFQSIKPKSLPITSSGKVCNNNF